MHRQAIVLLASICFSWNVQAQDLAYQGQEPQHYVQGKDLFDQKSYQAARSQFEDYLQANPSGAHAADASYFQALSALRLEQQDGEHLLEAFVRTFPRHPKAKLAFLELGGYYFDKGQYDDAIRYLEKADTRQLSQKQIDEMQFQLAYSYFTKKNFEQALNYFNQVKRGQNPYTYASSYYAGFIAYGKDDFDRALLNLEKAGENKAYAQVVPYMIANVYYKQKRYDELLDFGEEALNADAKPQNAKRLHLLVAEAAFELEKYSTAAGHYQEYLDSRGGRAEAKTYFRGGYAQYVSGNFESAETNFEQAASSKDEVSQYASYYLGALYLKQGKTQYAVAAFDKASKGSSDEKIKEDAAFHLAKVQYEAGNINEAINALSYFLETYPESSYSREASELLSEAYLNTTNYAKAVKHLESLPSMSYAVKKAYQKVTYLNGTQLFNRAKFYHAVQMFEKSLEYPIDKEIVALSNFWSGEAYSVGKKFEEAINSYAAVFRYSTANEPYYLKARYGIGYAYYNTQQYEKALAHFKYYVDKLEGDSNSMFYEDALLRLADCYYANKSYRNALDFYDKAIAEGNPEKDYAYFQKGMIFGVQGNLTAAASHFDLVIDNYKDSRFVDDAMFQKAQFHFVGTEYNKAAKLFTNVIKQKPESVFVPFALLKRAISNTNLKQYAPAAKDYKRLLDEFISHQLAEDAILGLQDVLSAMGKNDELDAYLAKYREANPEDEAVADISFESAKSLYFAQKYDKAVDKFKDFMTAYPKNSLTYEARYYIADAYYRQQKDELALEYFKQVVEDKQSNKVNRALNRIGELYMLDGNYEQSIAYYDKLADAARNRKEQYNAWAGMMKAYFALEMYDKTDQYARLVLEKGNVSVNATNEAQLYLGKSAYARGEYDKAIDEFLATLNTAKDVHGAEAQYLMADIFYQRGLYEQSLESLFDLNANFAIYTKWLGKSFLLIADNYIALDELFQAKATLNSVIEKSKDQKIVAQAKEKLAKVRQLEEEEAARKAAEQAKQAADSVQYEEIDMQQKAEQDSVQ